MAKERNLPQKATMTTSDYIRVVGSDNASYKQSVSGVMTAMGIDKVVNGANNPSVNSLAELKDSGFYSIGTATNYSDAPTNVYGFLSVYNGGVYRIQTYYAPSELKEYVRHSTNSGTTWSAWNSPYNMVQVTATTTADGAVSLSQWVDASHRVISVVPEGGYFVAFPLFRSVNYAMVYTWPTLAKAASVSVTLNVYYR